MLSKCLMHLSSHDLVRSRDFLAYSNEASPRSAFVEGHDDVAADDALGVHIVFRCEHMLRTVYVGAEGTSLRSEFPDGGEGEYLESAAVSQYRPVPGNESVETSGGLEDFQPRSEIKVVRVAENDLGLDVLLQIPVVYTLY